MAAQVTPESNKKNVLSIYYASFFHNIGKSMTLPLYPLFLIHVLKVEKMQTLGLIQTLALLASLIIMPITGRLADEKGKKGFILAGLGLNFLSRLSLAVANSWVHLIPIKMFQHIGDGIQRPIMAAQLAEFTDSKNRGYIFGLLESAKKTGAILGPVAGWFLLSYFLKTLSQEISYRLVFVLATAPIIVGIILVYLWTKNSISPTSFQEQKRPLKIPLSGMGKQLIIFTVICSFFEFWAVTESFIVVRATLIEGSQLWQASAALIIYWVINVAYVPVAFLSGRLSDRIGRKRPVLVGMLLLAFFSLAFVLSESLLSIGVLSLIFGLYHGFLKPSRTALVVDLAPSDMRAEALGSFSMYLRISSIPAPLIFGFLWDTFDWRTPFMVSGAFEIVCALLLIIFLKTQGNDEGNTE